MRSHPHVNSKRRRVRLFLGLLVPLFLWVQPVRAQTAPAFDTSATNLMVVLRESAGANKQDEQLQPLGKSKVKLPDGKEVEVDPGWYSYIGDMHIRFVFDGAQGMLGAGPKDLERLKLTPEAALDLAVANLKRIYGEPKAAPWNDLMQVSGKSPDFDSSYFLDREYWRGLLKQHPQGLVVAVPKRGGLLYAPLTDTKAVAALRKGVGYLHSSSERMRVSGALYLFKEDHWTVFPGARSLGAR